MSRALFTDEQILELRKNPYVYSVSQSKLSLTKEFKELFYEEYQNGHSPKKILEDHGFDIDTIGERCVWSIAQHIKDEYSKYGEFHEGYMNRRCNAAIQDSQLTEADQMNNLQHEVDYLKQEMDF